MESCPSGCPVKSNNTIYIDVNSGDIGETAMLRSASHEITHSINEWSPGKYKVLQDYVIEQFESDGSIELMVQEEIRLAKSNGQTLTYEEAMDEVTANACEMMLKDTKAIERIANEEPDMFHKIKIIINKIIDNIKQAFDGLRSGSVEHKRMSELLDDWTEIQNMWDDALVDSAKKSREAGKSEDGKAESDENVYSKRDFNNIKFNDNEIVYIDEKLFTRRSIADNSKYKDVRNNVLEMLKVLAKEHPVIVHKETGEKIYLDAIFADEYANSKDSLKKNNTRRNAKMNSAHYIKQIIENSKYYNHLDSKKNKK